MRMFKESILCRQGIELFRHKLWYKLNYPHMHYLYTSYKIAMLDRQHFARKFVLHANVQCVYIM